MSTVNLRLLARAAKQLPFPYDHSSESIFVKVDTRLEELKYEYMTPSEMGEMCPSDIITVIMVEFKKARYNIGREKHVEWEVVLP